MPSESNTAADPGKQAPTTAVTGRRKVTMRLAAIGLVLVPLIFVELGLRLFVAPRDEAVDYDPLLNMEQLRPLFVREQTDWIIPADRMNFFRPASFPADKSATTKRIFVLGGSTVQGRPYATETAFSTWLELRLRAACSQTSFEVINCGGVSYASYRVAKILEEVLDHQPDAIVLYTGHNEFLEDRTYANVRSMGVARRWVTRLGSQLHSVRLLQDALRSDPLEPTTISGEVNARLDHPRGLDGYQRDPGWKLGVEEHFHATLTRMVAACRQAAVPLIVCVPASDLINTPPFKMAPAPDLSEVEASQFTLAWSNATDVTLKDKERLAACDACLKLDPHHAGAHYIAGRLQLQRGKLDLARGHLIAARDHDVCPLRATSSIVQAVITVAADERLSVVDTTKLLDQRDARGNKIPDGIVDPEFFVDHVHPTIAGHQVLAQEIAARIAALQWFQPAEDAEREFQSLSGAHLQSLGPEYYERGKQRLQGLRLWASGRAGEVGLE